MIHTTAEATAALPGLLDELRRNPDDEATRNVLADAIADAGPSAVRRDKYPRWLKTCWQARVPPQQRGRNGLDAIYEFRQACQYPVWDHTGIALYAGVECFVTQPYSTVDDTAADVCRVAGLLGCAWVVAPASHYPLTAVTGILIPPIDEPPAGRWKQVSSGGWVYRPRQG